MAGPAARPAPLRAALGGGGAPLRPVDRAHFERRLGQDLGAVRVQEAPRAAEAARALGAAAFTLGPDIAFAPGRYAPDSPSGRRVLAHELAHVAQQGGGAPALGLGAAPLGVQCLVETLGGTWTTEAYRLVEHAGAHAGCTMQGLKFTPNARVDATRIGLVQRVTAYRGGAPSYRPPSAEARAVPTGQGALRSWIDRERHATPLYGMSAPPAGGGARAPTVAPPPHDARERSLAASAPQASIQWGWRYRDGAHGLQMHPAVIDDTPRLLGHGPDSGQVFETTALAVEGVQAGTYYGSVRWGWRSDAANRPSLEPLAVVGIGAPSSLFGRAAEAWNTAPGSGRAGNLQLPVPAGTAGRRLPREMTTRELQDRLREIEAQRAAASTSERLGLAGPRAPQSLAFEAEAIRRELEERAARAPPPTMAAPPAP
jgi:hypothetical protein